VLAVAIISLKTPPDVEAPLLARDLGTTAFEAGQLIRGVLPSVVLKTEDAARAEKLTATLTARGHQALTADLAQVVRHSSMFTPRGFRFEAQSFVAFPAQGAEQAIALADVRALIRANHVLEGEKVQKEKSRDFSLGRAALSGGLVMTKSVEKDVKVRTTDKEPVLYLFHRGGLPWLLSESALKYEGLGPKLKPGRPENFVTLGRSLKEACPGALFDERFLQFRGAPGAPNTADTLDLLAHLLQSSH
jgi:hypothetical protein